MKIKPAYWIGIMAVVGAIIGTIIGFIFPGLENRGAVFGMLIGITIGTSMYSTQTREEKSKQ
jgi:hypothetical protein